MKLTTKLLILPAIIGAIVTAVFAYDCVRVVFLQQDFLGHISNLKQAVESGDDSAVLRAELSTWSFLDEKKSWLPACDSAQFNDILTCIKRTGSDGPAEAARDWRAVITKCDYLLNQ
jgi:hypothetical protein